MPGKMTKGKVAPPKPKPAAKKKAVKPAKGLSKAMLAEQKRNKKNKPF